MPTPSFDDLLNQARQLSDAQSGSRTSTLLAKGVSDFVQNIINAAGTERKTYNGYLSPDGKFNAIQPFDTGGSLPQMLADRVSNGGPTPSPIPPGAFPLTEGQSSDYRMKSALEQQKSAGETERARIRAQAMIDAAKQRGSRSTSAVTAAVVPDIVRNAVYDEMEARMGTTIPPEQRTPLTIAHLKEFRQEGYIGDEFTKRMIPLLKDRILGLPKDAIDQVFQMSDQYNEKRFTTKPSAKPKTPPPGNDAFTAPKQKFANDADAVAAFKQGKVKSGETVSINGEDVVMK